MRLSESKHYEWRETHSEKRVHMSGEMSETLVRYTKQNHTLTCEEERNSTVTTSFLND